jgi:hypothetical protein
MSERTQTAQPEVLPHEAGVPQDAAPPAGAPPDEPAPAGAARPSVAPRARGWRDEAAGTALVSAAVGIWLIFAPEALGYGPEDAAWNPVVCGVLIVVFSIARVLSPRNYSVLTLITFVIAVWLAISAFILDAPPAGQWNQAGFGAIVALLSLIGLAGAQRGKELNPR